MTPKIWKLSFSEKVVRPFEKLPILIQKRIMNYLKDRVIAAHDPRSLGEPLKGDLKEFWRYRIGDYRVICSIQDDTLTLIMVDVGHRSKIYKDIS